MISQIISAISLLLFYFLASAQQSYHFRHLTMEDGLNDAKIASIVQDKFGYIWFGGNGVDKYNGYSFEHFDSRPGDSASLPDMNIRSMYCSKSGTLYISTSSGWCSYDYVKNNFRRNPFGLCASGSKFFQSEDGMIWMNDSSGIVVLNEKKGSFIRLSEAKDSLIKKIARLHVRDFASDRDGNMYLATEAGLYKINYKKWKAEAFYHDRNNPSTISQNFVMNIIQDQDGSFWVSTGFRNTYLDHFNPVTKKFTHYDAFQKRHKNWVDNRILDLHIDQKGRLWVAGLRSSLAMYNRNSDSFEFHIHDPINPSSPSSHTIYTMFEDRDGMLWLATTGTGVDYFQPANNLFSFLTKSSFQSPALVDHNCQSITEDSTGNLWIGTYKGLSVYNRDTKQFRNYFLADTGQFEANNSIRSLHTDETGTVWIGTGSGLNRWNKRTKKIEPVYLTGSDKSPYISFIYTDRQHKLWVCTPVGLFFFNKQTLKFEEISGRNDSGKWKSLRATTIYQDKANRHWVGLNSIGALLIDEKANTAHLYDFTFLLGRAGAYDYINSISEDETGVLWFSTFQGVIGLNPKNGERKYFRVLNGLPSDKTMGLRVDSLNRVWFASSKGLCMLDAQRKSISVFDIKDGLNTGYFYEGPAYTMQNGGYAYATYNGILFFDPYKIKKSNMETPFCISRFRIAGKPILSTVPAEERSFVQLRHNENFFTIEMLAFNYSNPKETWYAYKLDGFDKEWTYSKERSISYTNVPGGIYTFRYKATVNTTNWNIYEKQFKILIGTVFYKRWWFKTAGAILVVVIVYFVVRFRLLQQRRMHALQTRAQILEKEKALVQYENLKQHLNPHFLFNSLTSLRSLIRVDQKNAGAFLEKMSKIYRYILKSQDCELVLLKDEINFVQTYIELQQTRFHRGLYVQIDVHDDFMHRKIVPVTLQNLIDNAIKHNLVDAETPLQINIFVESDFLIVRNNMQKKEFVETSNRQGLQNMSSLYKYLDDRKLEIEETKQYFFVKIPLI